VDKPADLDVATVLAMGFPPYRRAPPPGASGLARRASRPT